MRDIERFPIEGRNSLWQWCSIKNPLITIVNFVVIYAARYVPSLHLKNLLYRAIGMKIGKDVAVGLGAIFDIFFPELIEIGDNTIIGYGTTVLAHEFLIDEWRKGKVKIGANVLIGANCTILPGVQIGNNAIISACSLVNRDVAPGEFVGGVPIKRIRRKR